MAETALFESVAQSHLAVDAAAGVIKNVHIVGFHSQHGRDYSPEALREAVPMYEGVRVNIDHPAKITDRRSWMNRIGKLQNVRIADDGLRGDLHYNPAHPYGPALAWAAENQPDTLGLSHTAFGAKKLVNGKEIIHKIAAVKSVDLVADPATTKGLMEDMEPDQDLPAEGDAKDFEQLIADAIHALVSDKDVDLAEKKKKINKALKLLQDAEEGDDKPEEDEEEDEKEEGKDDADDDDDDDDDEKKESVDPKKELARLKREKRARVLCESLKVAASEAFIEALAAVKTEKKMKALIEDRKSIVNRPKSHAPSRRTMKLDDFAEALKR